MEHNGQNLENVVYHSETTALCPSKAGWPVSDTGLDLGSDDACQRNTAPVKLGDSSMGYTHGCRGTPMGVPDTHCGLIRDGMDFGTRVPVA